MHIVCGSCGSEDLTRDSAARAVPGEIPIVCLECGWHGTRRPTISCPRCGSSDVADTPVDGWAYEDLDELREEPSSAAWGYVDKTIYRCLKCHHEWQKAGKYRPYGDGGSEQRPAVSVAFSSTWARIKEHTGEDFLTKTGKPFSYDFTPGAVLLRNTERALPRGDFEKAFDRLPVSGPGELQDLQGPSYIYALLNDARICIG